MGETQIKVSGNRLASLDALRGFNMFWLIGGEKIADALSRLNFPGAHLLAGQLNHAHWNGFTFYDLIYPMFIFVVGISITFSLEHRRQRGDSINKILLKIFTRTLFLFLLGVYMSNSGLNIHGWLTNLRWMGVLQRIALCYLGAAILVLLVKLRYQAIIAVFLLVGYWLLLRFVKVPGYGAGVWNPPEANFANYIDKLFLPGRRYYGTWDVEGLLSTFPALVSCQLGVFTGIWLKKDRIIAGKPLNKQAKAAILAIAGIIMAGVGILWGLDFPINKKIWTSSYTLLTGGLSAACMALFYWLIDIKAWVKWAFPFVVIGFNSIFIYLLFNFIPFYEAINSWIGGKWPFLLGDWQNLCVITGALFAGWLLLYVMYRRKIFLRL
jgi:Uncharacterized conserved protein